MTVFTRHTASQVEELSETQARVTVSMCDSFHNIVISVLVDLTEGEILDAQADFIRVPDEICKETGVLMSELRGVILGKGIRTNAFRILGGSTGCVHLTELVTEAAEALCQGKFAVRSRHFEDLEAQKNSITAEKTVKCHFHTVNSRQ